MPSDDLSEAIQSRDINRIIAVVVPAFKEAAKEVSERAHAMGIRAADGRQASRPSCIFAKVPE